MSTRHVILNFHGIDNCPKEREPGESSYWISPDMFLAIMDRVNQLEGRARVEVTFDDGNASDILRGAEGLARYGWAARFFVLADRIGQDGCMSASDIRSLVGMGHRVGTHGAAHVDWTRLDERELERELREARRIIADLSGQPVTEASIPFGRYDRKVLAALKECGYHHIYSSDGGPVLSARQPIPRNSIRRDMSLADVDAIILGQEAPLLRLRRKISRMKKRVL